MKMKMYQRERETMGDVRVPYFDGHPDQIMDWMQELEDVVARFRAKGNNCSITQFLQDVRSSLSADAAHWWDICQFLLSDPETSLQVFSMKYGADNQTRQAMTQQLEGGRDQKQSPLVVLRRMEQVHRTTHPDYALILQTLQQIDCPVLEIQLVTLPLEHPNYSWRAFTNDLHELYVQEVAKQRDLCRPFYKKGTKSIWMGCRDEFLHRRQFFDKYQLFCMLCMSNRHHTDTCQMMRDIMAVE